MEKKIKKGASGKLAKSTKARPMRPSLSSRKIVGKSTRAIEVSPKSKPSKRFNRIIPSRLAVLIILLLAVMVGAYAFFGSSYNDSLSVYFPGKKQITTQERENIPALNADCKAKKFEGDQILNAWMLEKSPSKKKMVRIAISKDDLDKIPLRSVAIKEGKYFIVNLLEPSDATISLLQGASEANPVPIEIKAYEDTCEGIPAVKTESWTAWPTN